jgi:hypothetical protein
MQKTQDDVVEELRQCCAALHMIYKAFDRSEDSKKLVEVGNAM